MTPFDIAPFALPNCPNGELRFEEPRDVSRLVVSLAGKVPRKVGVSYLQEVWPHQRLEFPPDCDLRDPFSLGWRNIDDQFNSRWQKAAVVVQRDGPCRRMITFKGLKQEFSDFPGRDGYDVRFRRTLGIRIEAEGAGSLTKVQAYTTSPPARSRLRVELDAGKRTRAKRLEVSGYNAVIQRVTAVSGVATSGKEVRPKSASKRVFEVQVRHMQPAHRYSHDEGHVTFASDRETFTISLSSLRERGLIWFAEQGFYITFADDPTSFADYRARAKGHKTVNRRLAELPEQSFAGAFHGQPRPHAVAYSLGCKHARQRFWLEPNGDVVLTARNLQGVSGKDVERYRNDGDARFLFGMEGWPSLGRFPDPAPVLAYNIHLRRGDVRMEQKSFAVPLGRSILDGELRGDDAVVALVRFRFRNEGEARALAELPIRYSENCGRYQSCYGADAQGFPVPACEPVPLSTSAGRIASQWKGEPVLRCTYESSIEPAHATEGLVLRKELVPGESWEAVLKIPFIALETASDLAALDALEFDHCYEEVVTFWGREGRRGAQLKTPVPQLNALYASHLSHVQITDFSMPDEPWLINTSVATSTYGNFCNESCMIIQELDERGLHEEARRRLEVWVKYQGTKRLLGNFTDDEGVYYGAGGFESGQSINQHHGWVLWCLSQHYFMTRDVEWLKGVADSLVSGMEWVFRQRRATVAGLPHSRGWEQGFLPAGGLEDVGDYSYWLATQAMTLRGVESAARALEAIGHPEARRLLREAAAFRRDLKRGFETQRRHTPLVRLRDGRWVPTYPSRLYRRGRDCGWIREVLEGSVYLLLGGLLAPGSRQAGWILDDYQDNRYMCPPLGYALSNPEAEWFHRGGFTMQPNLLAGLMPHLDRDEIEVYLWMFFNAWCACYREEIGAMAELPTPVLGYSNAAHPKTSDQSNAVKWLRYMFVYVLGNTLHLGRAIPRDWLRGEEEIWAEGVATRFGKVGIRYESSVNVRRIKATVGLSLREAPGRILVRFRHPEKKPVKSVTVNGKGHSRFDAKRGDVEITGMTGKVMIVARY